MSNNKTLDPLDDELIIDVVDSLLNGLAPNPHARDEPHSR